MVNEKRVPEHPALTGKRAAPIDPIGQDMLRHADAATDEMKRQPFKPFNSMRPTLPGLGLTDFEMEIIVQALDFYQRDLGFATQFPEPKEGEPPLLHPPLITMGVRIRAIAQELITRIHTFQHPPKPDPSEPLTRAQP